MTKKSLVRATSRNTTSKTKITKAKTSHASKKTVTQTATKKPAKAKTKAETVKRKKVTKVQKKKSKPPASTTKKLAAKLPSSDSIDELGIVIVDDDIEIDQEKINEERRAYLEEARSQEAFD